jgi:hypothetical protein
MKILSFLVIFCLALLLSCEKQEGCWTCRTIATGYDGSSSEQEYCNDLDAMKVDGLKWSVVVSETTWVGEHSYNVKQYITNYEIRCSRK